MNKKTSRVIMDRTNLRNRILKTRSNGDKEAFNKQRNYCELQSFIRTTKQDYNSDLDHRKVANNKSFWKYIKPLLIDKNSNLNKITLMKKEKNLLLEKNDDFSETFNDFFYQYVSKLNIHVTKIPWLIVTKPRTELDTRL